MAYSKKQSAQKGVTQSIIGVVSLVSTGIILQKMEKAGLPTSDEIKIGISVGIIGMLEMAKNWFKNKGK